VNILIIDKRFDQNRIIGTMGQDSKLDLGIISGNKTPTLLRNKCLPDLLALLPPDWNILEIGIGTAEPSGSGYGLVV